MEHEETTTPATIEYEPTAIITTVERWQDFGAALNALSRYAFREAERELTRERKRGNKAAQRERESAHKQNAHSLDQSERPTG